MSFVMYDFLRYNAIIAKTYMKSQAKHEKQGGHNYVKRCIFQQR